MARKTPEEIKKELLERKAQLEQRLKDIEAEEAVRKRKLDTRRKAVTGALCLHHAETNPEFRAVLTKLFASQAKESDKALFPDFL